MAIYQNLNSLKSSFEGALQQVLQQDVVPTVENAVRSAQQEVIYNSYTPAVYSRRKALGKNFQSHFSNKYTVQIYDIARPDYSVFGTSYEGPPGMFAQWINDGNVPNVFNNKSYPWMQPRPFYKEALTFGQQEIISAVQRGIKREM